MLIYNKHVVMKAVLSGGLCIMLWIAVLYHSCIHKQSNVAATGQQARARRCSSEWLGQFSPRWKDIFQGGQWCGVTELPPPHSWRLPPQVPRHLCSFLGQGQVISAPLCPPTPQPTPLSNRPSITFLQAAPSTLLAPLHYSETGKSLPPPQPHLTPTP